MNNPNQPNLARSLIAIHTVISRALQVSTKSGDEYLQNGFPDEITKMGFLDYVSSLNTSLRVHHQIEDEQIFPYFREILADIPYGQLIKEHHLMEPLLDTLEIELQSNLFSINKKNMRNIHTILNKIQQLWHPHIKMEENGFTVERLGELLEVSEHIRLLKQVGDYNQKHALPPELIIPFTIYNLTKENRVILTGAMPRN